MPEERGVELNSNDVFKFQKKSIHFMAKQASIVIFTYLLLIRDEQHAVWSDQQSVLDQHPNHESCQLSSKGNVCKEDTLENKRRALLDWIRLHGRGFEKIEMRDYEYGGTALFATDDIEQDELIGVIPYNLTFSLEAVHLSGPMHPLLRDLYLAPQTPPELITSIFILHEAHRGTKSFFAPYIAMLPPASEISSALMWPEDTSRCAPLSRETRERAERLRAYFERVHERLATYVLRSPELRAHGAAAAFDPSLYPRDRVLWAVALVLSRAWTDTLYRPRNAFYRMVPVADIGWSTSLPSNTFFGGSKRHEQTDPILHASDFNP